MKPWLSPVSKSSLFPPILFVSVLAQDAGSFATLNIDFGTPTGKVWGRYVVSDKATVRSGWMNPQVGEHSFAITSLGVANTTHVKGIVYSSGCALQTFDIAIQEPRTYQYSFPCEPISQIEIQGSIPQQGRLYDGDVRVEAKYVVDWASDFFKYNDGTTTEVPLGGAATLDAQNHFHLRIPDLSQDKLAGSPNHGGEIRIFIRNQTSGQIVDQWRFKPQDPKLESTKFGGIPISLIKPDNGPFVFCPVRSVSAHDQFGFALRSEVDTACAP